MKAAAARPPHEAQAIILTAMLIVAWRPPRSMPAGRDLRICRADSDC
jgi:hypothetical protein